MSDERRDNEVRLVAMTAEQAERFRDLGADIAELATRPLPPGLPGSVDAWVRDGTTVFALADAYENGITEGEARVILSITGPRVADPDAERYGDWSVLLDRKLRAAFSPPTEVADE